LCKSLTVWCLTDYKPGHQSQLHGLTRALARRLELDVTWADAREPLHRRLFPPQGRPDITLAAGHRTHLRALLVKWWYGGRAVVIMKPSLPRRLFDLCIIPEHDGVPPGPRVLCTTGTLNDIRPGEEKDPRQGLIMIGGPSHNHDWSDGQMVAQLEALKRALPGVRWTLTTSRRTPSTFAGALAGLLDEGFVYVPPEQTDRDWLRERYGRSALVWVSEDSASMVYEGLTAGADVGVLEVPRRRDSRVSGGLELLLERGSVSTLQQVQSLGHMPAGSGPLCEADRVAEYLEAWLHKGEPVSAHESPAGSAEP
jgi:mitochondrial fission protein ELM1